MFKWIRNWLEVRRLKADVAAFNRGFDWARAELESVRTIDDVQLHLDAQGAESDLFDCGAAVALSVARRRGMQYLCD